MVRQHHNTTATPTTTLIAPPKRKKGRPSLQDIQQRKLFQQQLQLLQNNNNNNNNANNNNNNNNKKNDNHESEKQNPNSLPRRARSSRRTSNTLPAQFLLGSDSDSDYPISPDSPNSGSDSDSQDERTSKKVRRLSSSSSSSQGEKGSKATDSGNNETRKLVGPTYGSTSAASATALPDRKLLLPVLDKLQKKDTRGVFAEPVNPEELPDYDEVIERPMDFGTVREKLNRGQYRSMEQLEDDIYLICSNAMQYNSPSTIFFRQARSIQELAKKEFEILRQDAGQIELPPRPRRGRPPGSKNQKKPVESKPPDRSVSKSPSEATPVFREEDATRSGSYNLRKGPSLYRFPRHLDNYFDYSASTPRFLSTMFGKKLCASDDNRRETYSMSSQFGFDQGSLATYGDPDKQLIAVGLASDHGYARSLVRFAADLGPVAWRVVSNKLKAVLPPGVDFGPGWVEETKASPTQLPPLPENLVQPNSSLQDTFRSEPQHSLTSVFTNSAFAHRPSASCSENAGGGRDLSCSSEWSTLKGINGLIGPGSSFQTQPGPLTYPRMDGLAFASSSQFQEGMFRPASSSFMNTSSTPHALAPCSFDASTSTAMNRMPSPPVDFHGMMNAETEMGVQGTAYWQNLSMQERWDRPYSAELNGGFQASGSRNTNLPIGSPPQLDLVLQL